MAYENDVLTRNENDELAVRVVQSVGDNPASSYDDIYTRDTNGKLAVRVVGAGGGGGDSHNKGYFATQSALETAYPTAEAGDYAIVGSTDTVWVWDDDNDAWIDTDTKGEVESVNGQTGMVMLNAEDVGAVPQYSSMPIADADNVDEIVQFTGTTDVTYTNGFFYKNLQTSGPAATVSQTSGSGFTSLEIDLDYFVEHQHPAGDETINLTITGVDAPELVNTSTISGDLEFEVDPVAFNTFIEGLYNETPFETATVNLTYDGSNWAITSGNISLWIPGTPSTEMEYSPIDSLASVGITVTGGSVTQGTVIQVELYGTFLYIDTAGALTDYGVAWKGYPEVDSVVTIDYTEDGGTYTWTRIDVQPAPVMPDPLPDQTGNAGKFLTTDGTDASWAAVNALQNTATGTDSIATGTATAAGNQSTAFGESAEASTQDSTAYGYDATAKTNIGATAVGASSQAVGQWSSAYGFEAQARNTNCIQLGSGTNTTSGTLKVGFKNNGNYELLNNQGFIPTDRLTKVNSTITLTAAGWSSNTQTVTVTGMTATGVVLVSPDPTDQAAYTSAGILCTAQAADSLTFTATTTPTGDIDVVVVML